MLIDRSRPDLRKQFLVDRKTQFRIAGSLALFWLIGGLLVAGFPLFAMLTYQTMIDMKPMSEAIGNVWDASWFPAMMSIVVIPLGIWYCIRFSNRIAGPVFRMHRECRNIIDGKESTQVVLRTKDYFQSFGGTINELRDVVLDLQARVKDLESDDSPGAPASAESESITGDTPKPLVSLDNTSQSSSMSSNI